MLPTIDQLCRGHAGANIKRVIQNCADNRYFHIGNRGFSPKKTKRYLGEIPLEFQLRKWTCRNCYDARVQGPHMDLNQYGLGCKKCGYKGKMDNPYYNYFHPAQDKHERKKHRYQFLQKAPEFKCVEKL